MQHRYRTSPVARRRGLLGLGGLGTACYRELWRAEVRWPDGRVDGGKAQRSWLSRWDRGRFLCDFNINIRYGNSSVDRAGTGEGCIHTRLVGAAPYQLLHSHRDLLGGLSRYLITRVALTLSWHEHIMMGESSTAEPWHGLVDYYWGVRKAHHKRGAKRRPLKNGRRIWHDGVLSLETSANWCLEGGCEWKMDIGLTIPGP